MLDMEEQNYELRPGFRFRKCREDDLQHEKLLLKKIVKLGVLE
jgi:hypothetical protein